MKVNIKLSYELKIYGKDAPIIDFSLLADDKKTIVYFTCLYLSHGLHELVHAKSLVNSKKIIAITMSGPMVAFSSSDSARTSLSFLMQNYLHENTMYVVEQVRDGYYA